MKVNQRDIEKLLARSASKEQMETARQRILNYVRSEDSVESLEFDKGEAREESRRQHWGRIAMIPAAAAVIAAVFIGLAWRQDALAIGESVDGSLYRVTNGRAQSLRAGETISIGDTVRSDRGGTLKLTDGSGVEMKSESELSFEGAKSAVQINLSHGSVIVNSETQPVVQTKDIRVPIAGTVLVNAESEGSRVAVIQGEARVRQGAIEKTLRPGEQIATNPSMQLSPVNHEIAWSHRAVAHMALLQQSVVAPANPREANTPKWEVVSIRPCENTGGGGPRGGGGNSQANQSDPERLVMSCQNIWTLVMTAYGQIANLASYEAHTLPIVGPASIVSELYTIEAKAEKPVGRDMMRGPMLQTILEDRFKLKLHRENRNIPLLVLTVAKGTPKMQQHQEGSCVVLEPAAVTPALPPGKVFCGAVNAAIGGFLTGFNRVPMPGVRPPSTPRRQAVDVKGLTVEEFIQGLMYPVITSTNIPVVDKTGMTGKFDFRVEYGFSPQEIKFQVQRTGRPESDFDTSPTVYEALQDQLGLKLEETKGPWPHLVIDHVERPSPN